jgi:hypothetical protein
VSLRDIRKQVIDISGRVDLVIDEVNYANNGVDFFIQTGQDWLDEQGDVFKARGRSFQALSADSWYALIDRLRVVHEVWLSSDEEDDRWKLEKMELGELHDCYSEDPGSMDSGMPLYYAVTEVRQMPEVASQVLIDQYGTTTYTEAVDHYDKTAIIFMPPCEDAVTIEVHGLFSHPKLTNPTDTNYWTEKKPFLLVLASLRQIEITYRNTQGANDYENAIRKELIGAEFDFADFQSSEYQRMEG